MSVSSKEAILYAGVFNFSSKSTAVSSNGVENTVESSPRAYLNKALCHSKGV